MRHFLRISVCVAGLFAFVPCNSQTVTIQEINPTHSVTGSSGAIGGSVNAATGGRVNHVAHATDDIYYAASEYGGLYKSTDGGRTWARLDSHIPTKIFSVEASPANPNSVIATSLYDGRVVSLAGINMSSDGGITWTKPPSATPPNGFCASLINFNEPAAFGIAFDPDTPTHVFVGTDCGLARSTDGGATWTFLNPGPGTLATNVFGVVVHHGGTIDTCGSGGHRRSVNGGANWTTA